VFYHNGRKVVPSEIGRLLNHPLALAVWFMDDGYRRNDCRGLHLNTQAFREDEQHQLQRTLEKTFGLRTTIHWANGRPKLYFPVSQAEKLRRLLRGFNIPGLQEKLS
jgi:hypothetical protein